MRRLFPLPRRIRRRSTSLLSRVIRWARTPWAVGGTKRRFIIIQIDGLSHTALNMALERGYMPGLAALLRSGRLTMHRMPVGLPTSTPAFQAGVMYGGPVDIPAFEFLDKRTGEYLWFPRPWVSARIEAAHAEGRKGIMENGRTYGCVFGGGADDTVFTFAHLLRPSPAWSKVGLRAALFPWLILTWAALKMAARTIVTALRWLARFLRNRFWRGARLSSRRLFYRLLITEWLRGLFTLSVTADIYAGVSAIYVNYVDYDIPAHALGPLHSSALRTLCLVDRSIKNIARVISRVPEWRYDLYVLSDHGMTRSVPFEALSGGISAAEAVLIAFQCTKHAEPHADGKPPTRREFRWPFASASQRHLAYLEPRSRERDAVWAGRLCVVPAGPNMNIYLLGHERHVSVEQIEIEYPGALETLSRHPGIGFLLARDRGGPVCFFRGILYNNPPAAGADRVSPFRSSRSRIGRAGIAEFAGDAKLGGHRRVRQLFRLGVCILFGRARKSCGAIGGRVIWLYACPSDLVRF